VAGAAASYARSQQVEDGLRSWPEYLATKKRLPDASVVRDSAMDNACGPLLAAQWRRGRARECRRRLR
jgi:hypothetical protein